MTIEVLADEQDLWFAVLQRAIDDARFGPNTQITATEGYAARRWLTTPNKDFNEVCYLAGLDPVAVRERAQSMFPDIEAPKPEQPKRRGKLHTAHGMTMTFGEWANYIGISRGSLYRRFYKVGSLEAVIAAHQVKVGGKKEEAGGSFELEQV